MKNNLAALEAASTSLPVTGALILDSITPGTAGSNAIPVIRGHPTVPVTYVKLFSDRACTSILATGTSLGFQVGMSVNAVLNGTLSIYGEGISVDGSPATPCISLTSYTHDNVAPVVSITTPASGATLNQAQVSSVTISGACSENGASVSIGGSFSGTATCAGGAYTVALDLTSAPDGALSFTASQIDEAGNFGTSATVTLTKDATLPTVAITSPASGGYANAANTGAFTVSGTCSDNGQTVTIGGSVSTTTSCAAGAWSVTLDLSALANGTVTVTADLSDTAGNAAPQATRSFTKDATLPTVAITSPASGAFVTSGNLTSFTVSGTCLENGQSVVLSGAASASVTCTAGAFSHAFDLTALSEGSFTIKADHGDAAGNAAAQSSRSFTKDTVAPTVAITSPTAGTYVGSAGMSSETVSGTCFEEGRNVTLSGQASGSGTCTSGAWSVAVDFSAKAEGALSFTATLTDAAGNSGSDATGAIVKDTTAPTLSIGAPSSTLVLGTSGSISFPLTYSDTHLGTINLTSSDVTLNTTGGSSCTILVSNGGTSTPSVTLSSCTAPGGTVGITVAASTGKDLALNGNAAAGPSTTVSVVSAPTLSLSDGTTGSQSYIRQRAVALSIGSDAQAAKWCLSETQTAAPASGTAACTGGAGSSNGCIRPSPRP